MTEMDTFHRFPLPPRWPSGLRALNLSVEGW